jgi:hypothetical protein
MSWGRLRFLARFFLLFPLTFFSCMQRLFPCSSCSLSPVTDLLSDPDSQSGMNNNTRHERGKGNHELWLKWKKKRLFNLRRRGTTENKGNEGRPRKGAPFFFLNTSYFHSS